MMDKRNWTKIQIDILNDYKVGKLPDNLWRLNIEIKLLANDEGILPTEGDMAFHLRRDPSTLEDDLKELARVGLIAWTKDEDWGRWFIPGFVESQGPVFVSPYPENWDYLRQQALTRDNGLCLYCGNIATHVDHIIPVTKDGPHALFNLASACEHCNKSKNNSDLFTWYPKQPYFSRDRLDLIKRIMVFRA